MFIICIIPFLEYKLHEDKKLSLLFTDRFKVTGTLSGKCGGGGGTVRFFFDWNAWFPSYTFSGLPLNVYNCSFPLAFADSFWFPCSKLWLSIMIYSLGKGS